MEGLNIETYISPIITVFCLCVGFVVKNTPYFERVANRFIPLIVFILGLLLGLATQGLSIEAMTTGAVSGLYSVAIYEVVVQTFFKGGDKK